MHGLDRLGDGRLAVGPVVVEDVDAVGAQPLERAGQGAAEVVTRAAPSVAHPELGREHGLVAPAFEDLAEELLALAAAVDVRGVEERDPLGEGGLDDCPRPLEVEAAAEVVAPEADARDLQAARPQLVGTHHGILPR